MLDKILAGVFFVDSFIWLISSYTKAIKDEKLRERVSLISNVVWIGIIAWQFIVKKLV
ncbi:hypothetical protein [Peptoniphilus asaccharolyticus]